MNGSCYWYTFCHCSTTQTVSRTDQSPMQVRPKEAHQVNLTEISTYLFLDLVAYSYLLQHLPLPRPLITLYRLDLI